MEDIYFEDKEQIITARIDKKNDEELVNILEQIYLKYSPLSEQELIAITHAKGTPWYETYVPVRFYLEIKPQLIKKYYDDLLKKK